MLGVTDTAWVKTDRQGTVTSTFHYPSFSSAVECQWQTTIFLRADTVAELTKKEASRSQPESRMNVQPGGGQQRPRPCFVGP